jgi:hypothetical protein
MIQLPLALLPRLLPVALVPAFVLAPAPDVTTTWNLTGNVEGVTFTETCALTQSDVKLSGTCKDDLATRVVTGSVADKSLTFSHPSEYQGQALTLTFTGHVDDAGALSGAVDVQPLGYSGTFSATKAVPVTLPGTPSTPPPSPSPTPPTPKS